MVSLVIREASSYPYAAARPVMSCDDSLWPLPERCHDVEEHPSAVAAHFITVHLDEAILPWRERQRQVGNGDRARLAPGDLREEVVKSCVGHQNRSDHVIRSSIRPPRPGPLPACRGTRRNQKHTARTARGCTCRTPVSISPHHQRSMWVPVPGHVAAPARFRVRAKHRALGEDFRTTCRGTTTSAAYRRAELPVPCQHRLLQALLWRSAPRACVIVRVPALLVDFIDASFQQEK